MRPRMVIGVDFDNTIVCYDGLFHQLAREQGLLPEDCPPSKDAVRDHLRRAGQEDRWTELQGQVYGPGMRGARWFPGVPEFFSRCRSAGQEVFIISQRTRYPFLGPRHDLHRAARDFLAGEGGHAGPRLGVPPDHVYFHETKAEKVARINDLGCTHFIDDLPEILAAEGLRSDLERILFDPNGRHADRAGLRRVGSWPELESYLL